MRSWALWSSLALGVAACSGDAASGGGHGAPGSDAGPASGDGADTSLVDGGSGSSGGAQDAGAPPAEGGGQKPPVAGDSGGPAPIVGSTGVTVMVTPSSSAEGDIVSAIESAKTSVHMTMYILDDTKVVNALIAQKKAGLEVEVVMNQTFPSGTTQSNPTTYANLQAAGVGVVWRNGPANAASGAYTHEKTFILDHAQAWIMTINLDKSSYTDNREYIAIDDDAADVAEAEAIFTADYTGAQTLDAAPLVVSPTNSRSSIVTLIASATKTLDVEVEEFSDLDKNGVVDAVAAAAGRGVETRIVVANGAGSTNQTSAVSQVKAAGAKVVVSGGTSGSSTSSNPYIHAKAITVDCSGTTCKAGFMGSENFSAGSLEYNRELGLLLTDATELAKIETAINADFASGTAQ